MSHLLGFALPDEFYEELAERVAARVIARLRDDLPTDGWLDAERAAEYLGFSSTQPIYKLKSRREIPYFQDKPGGRLWFDKRQLDEWRQASLVGAED